MARTGSASGKIIIAEAGEAVDFSVNFSPSFTNVTEHVTGKIVIPADATVSIGLGGITILSFIWFRATDVVTKNPKAVEYTVLVLATGDGVHATELLMVASENGDADELTVIAQSGNDTLVEYALAGV